MSLTKWKRLRLRREIKNPWWTYRDEELELPSGKGGEINTKIASGEIWEGMTLAAWLLARIPFERT